jgi:hypothetical protein
VHYRSYKRVPLDEAFAIGAQAMDRHDMWGKYDFADSYEDASYAFASWTSSGSIQFPDYVKTDNKGQGFAYKGGTYNLSGIRQVMVSGKANQGGDYDWLNTTSDVFSALGIGGTPKTELIEYAVRSNYKSAQTRAEFSKLRPTQQAWRTTNTLGKTGAQYLKYSKGLGVVGNVVGVTSAGVQLIQNPTAGNATRLAVQGVAIGAAFIPVVGWGVSLGIGAADLIWGDDFYNWIDK